MLTTATITNAALSLILVIALILIVAQLFRWWQNERLKLGHTLTSSAPGIASHGISELDIIATRAIDFKRKLVLVRRGDKLHLLLCGESRDIVVETGIPYQVPHEKAHPAQSDS